MKGKLVLLGGRDHQMLSWLPVEFWSTEACSLRGQRTGMPSETVLFRSSASIHLCSRISSSVGRADGDSDRHRRMRSSHMGDNFRRKWISARRICSSRSNGMSPQTMSYRRIPKDQTVAARPLYLLRWIHSGGLYTRVPAQREQPKHRHRQLPSK